MASILPPMPLDAPQPEYHVPALDTIPDTADDQPVPGKSLHAADSKTSLSTLIYGAAPLSTIYNSQDTLDSPTPFRAVRLALRYGINVFDTSPFYGASEIILGQILQALKEEFPRTSYQLITKCGRFGYTRKDFDYSPSGVRKSVERSCNRLGTDYLDVVYVHDVEFIATPVWPRPNSGNHALILQDEKLATEWGLAKGGENKVHGDGDQQVLNAVMELQRLKEEGIIGGVGISGLPLPTLLRLALLVLHKTGKPLDNMLSYSHFNLQNEGFAAYYNEITQRAKVGLLLTASPFSMGLLTNSPPPWHPAPDELKDVVETVRNLEEIRCHAGGLVDVALGASFRREGPIMGGVAKDVGTVVGLGALKEIHESVAVWREVSSIPSESDKRRELENKVKTVFKDAGWFDVTWCAGFKEDSQ